MAARHLLQVFLSENIPVASLSIKKAAID